jgi:hypothetical protein
MNKLFIIALILVQNAQMFVCQTFISQVDEQKLPVLGGHYVSEFTFDSSTNIEAWTGQEGLHVAFGTTDELYFRKEVPQDANLSVTCKYTAWKGERVNAQLLVWSADNLEQVRVQAHDLRSADGNIIAKEYLTFELVRYVLSNYPYADRSVVCGDSPYKQGFLMPDRFETFDRFDLEAQSVRPIWMMLDIPSDAKSGNYKGVIEVKTNNATAKLQIEVHVQNQLLPPPHQWEYRLDLWQNPWAVAWNSGVDPWSDEHKRLLKKHLKLYADAGGKYITTYAVHSPWSDNSYWIEGGMIEWIKKSDNLWAFDYTLFDTYVELAMECGIDKAITLYTPIPWGNRFRYLDEQTGNYLYESWEPASDEFRNYWHIFLTDLKLHLQQKQWLDITYLGINENPLEQTIMAINVIKSHDRNWKITYAGNWHEELNELLDDYSYLYGNEPDMKQQEQRNNRKSASTTFYVCCNPAVPNNFIFSPPIEGRWLSWYAMAHHYDGFLRWAYDAWTQDPTRDARHGAWAAGDCFLVYPGGKSCIRFEKLREGIVDYEKMRILREKADRSNQPAVKQLLKQLDEHLKIFLSERDFDTQKICGDIRKGQSIIKELSEIIQ